VGPRATFDPWGRSLDGALATPFGFNGKRWAESIYDYGARWYDPQMGRFLQPDPVLADPYDPQGLSRYSYARNDPVGRVDPTGMWSLSVNAWGGYYDNYGFTGVVLGGTLNGSDSTIHGGVSIRDVLFAEYERIETSLSGMSEALRVGAFQYFNHTNRPLPQVSSQGGVGALSDSLRYLPNPRVSEAGLAFILSQEGFRSVEYLDTAGNPTIGFGHKMSPGEQVDSPLSVEDGVRLFHDDIASRVDPYLGSSTIKVALSQHQVDALGSFIFNVGGGAFSRSTLLQQLNRAEFDAVSREFRRWVYSGGERIPGLEIRRAEEAAIFLGR
jgi:lysozyme